MNKILLAGVFAAAFGAAPANATLQIALDVSGTDFLCVDNAACDTNPAVGVLQIGAQTVNGVAIAGAVQEQTIGAVNSLNTSSLIITNLSAVAKSLDFVVGGTDFVGPVTGVRVSGSGTWENAGGSTAALEWFADAANGQGAGPGFATPGALISSFSNIAIGDADSFSHDGGSPFVGSLFSMTESASGVLVAGGSLVNRGQAEIATVPEPSTWAMMLVGFLALGFGALSRKREGRGAR